MHEGHCVSSAFTSQFMESWLHRLKSGTTRQTTRCNSPEVSTFCITALRTSNLERNRHSQLFSLCVCQHVGLTKPTKEPSQSQNSGLTVCVSVCAVYRMVLFVVQGTYTSKWWDD